MIPIVIGALSTVTEGLVQRLGGLGNSGTGGDGPNYCIVEIGKNTEESLGDEESCSHSNSSGNHLR